MSNLFVLQAFKGVKGENGSAVSKEVAGVLSGYFLGDNVKGIFAVLDENGIQDILENSMQLLRLHTQREGGGNMAEWLGCWTWTLVIPSSSPPLTASRI